MVKDVAVITGGSGGMGFATAKIIGQDKYLIICDCNQEKLDSSVEELKAQGIECEGYVFDVSDKDSVDALAKYAAERGKVTSVIHCAGVSPRMGSAEKIIKINAIGTSNINNAFYEMAGEGFVIVDVSSMSAYMMPEILFPKVLYKYARTNKEKFLKNMVGLCNIMPTTFRSGLAYILSKNFVIWCAKKDAAKFGAKGARVLSVSPGSFDTDMGQLEKDGSGGCVDSAAAIKRFGRPEEIANLLAFCVSDRASYITGVDILCDGGTVSGLTIKDMLSVGKAYASGN
ncbi:MAG: SDR family oxidoreductase [Oscillospiraceae bacterium]|jgi:NAD(P)-dependent dehydrogenase (short-subunit alcohol dehydrogenase family)|nr:SDR family oxidoreductase [Oscillospiraceae bacterium]